MLRPTLLKLWDELPASGLWAAPLNKALDLTPHQAYWKPDPDRHSIWQTVNHISFWREHHLNLLAGKPRAPDDVVARRNWEAPDSPSDLAWRAALDRLAQTHARIRDAIADEQSDLQRVPYVIAHDSYHLGQIMLLRALQGLPPIE